MADMCSDWHARPGASKLASVISTLGDGDFCTALLDSVSVSLAPADHCSIFYFDETKRAQHIGTASLQSLELGISSAERYAGGLYVYDPLHAALRSTAEAQSIRIFQLTPDNVKERLYRESLEELRTVQRLSVLRKCGERWFSLNLYRSRSSGDFSERDILSPTLTNKSKRNFNGLVRTSQLGSFLFANSLCLATRLNRSRAISTFAIKRSLHTANEHTPS
jgi:hypothetical protein